MDNWPIDVRQLEAAGGAGPQASLDEAVSRHGRHGANRCPPSVTFTPYTVTLASPLGSVSTKGPSPAKKCGAAWSMSGTNAFIENVLLLVVTSGDAFTVVDRSNDAAITMDHAIGSPGERRNAALLQCDSEYVLLLGSVDRLLPGAAARLLTTLAESEADAAYGFVITPRSTFLSALPFEM